MLQTRDSFISKLNLTVQIIITVASLWLAIFIVNMWLTPLAYEAIEYKIFTSLVILLWYIGLNRKQLGRVFRLRSYGSLLFDYIKTILVLIMVLLSLLFLGGYHEVPRWLMVIFPCLNLVMLFSYQFLFYCTLKRYREQGRNVHSAVLIGGKSVMSILEELERAGDLGIKVVGICSDSTQVKAKYGDCYPIYPRSMDIVQIMDKHHIDEVIYSGMNIDRIDVAEKVSLCQELGIMFRLQSEFLNIRGMESEVSFINNSPFLTYLNVPSSADALGVKVLLDKLMSFLALLFCTPLFLLLGLLIKLSDGGPVFFAQERVGKNGRRFQCYKFRTMVVNAEALKADLEDQNEQEGPVFKIEKDPRITKIGRFLRKTSLDELPQFYNVLKGDMSVVGPRPPLPDEVVQYDRWQRRRLSMKPGITCIWQTSGRNNIGFDRWMEMDLQYIDSWSLRLDFILILRTIKTVFVGSGH